MLFFVEGIGIKQLVHMLRDLYEFWPKKQVGGFMSFYDEGEVDRNDWIHFFPVIALIIEYSEELERLDRLVDGFFKYHRSDNKLKIKDKEL